MGIITEYPEVTALVDDDMLLINKNGHLKQIKKKNCGFSGGGGSTGNAKMKMVDWGTRLVIDDSNVISFLFMFGSNLYSIWIPSTTEIHVRDLYISDENFGNGSISFNDRVLNIRITITRENKKITIESDSNMTMAVWYS